MLALPDRRLRLDPVDRLARPRERFTAMRRRDRHDHARLAQRHAAHTVLRRRRAQLVRADAVAQDRRDALLCHLRVRLVLQALHLARDPLEDHHRARAVIADRSCHAIQGQRLAAHPHVHRRLRCAAAHRRDQRQLVLRREHRLCGGVVAIDGHPHRHPLEHLPQRLALGKRAHRIGHRRAVAQLELQRAGSRALAQHREQTHVDDHARVTIASPL